MQHSNEIKIESQGGVTIMEIQGDITAFSEPFLNEAYQKANAEGATRLLLKIDEGWLRPQLFDGKRQKNGKA